VLVLSVDLSSAAGLASWQLPGPDYHRQATTI